MAFEWNFMQPQKIETKLKGMDAVQDSIQAPYTNPYERASYMDAYEADQNAQAQAAQQAMDQKSQRIASLEAQIASLEKSIADKTAQLQNWTGKADKIAAIEASKINSQDPTMVWRWNEARKDADRQAELNRIASKSREQIDNKIAQEKFKNTVDMLVGQRTSTTPAGMEQQLRNLEATIRDGKNIGADVSMLEKRKNEIEDSLYGKGQPSGEFNASNAPENLKATVQDFLNQKKSSEEIGKFIDEHKDLDNDDRLKLNTAYRDAVRTEKNKADEADFKSWAKNKGYEVGKNPQFDKSLRAAWKRERGK